MPASTKPFQGVQQPILPVGKILLPPDMSASNGNTVTLTAARYYCSVWTISRPMTIAGAKAFNTGSGDNGKKIKIAFYNEGTSGGLGTLAKSFGEATLSGSSGVRTLASSWSVTPGVYYGVMTSDTAPVMLPMCRQAVQTGVGYLIPDRLQGMVGGFAVDSVNCVSTQNYIGDYVDGVYANFPESTGLALTNSIYAQGVSFPYFGIYA